MSESHEYTLHWRGQETGPFTLGQIKRKVSTGKISLDHEVLLGDGRWITLHEFFSPGGEGAAEDVHQPEKVEKTTPLRPNKIPARQTSRSTRSRRRFIALGILISALLAGAWFFWLNRPKASSGIADSRASQLSAKPKSLKPPLKSSDKKENTSSSAQSKKSSRSGSGEGGLRQNPKWTKDRTSSHEARETIKQNPRLGKESVKDASAEFRSLNQEKVAFKKSAPDAGEQSDKPDSKVEAASVSDSVNEDAETKASAHDSPKTVVTSKSDSSKPSNKNSKTPPDAKSAKPDSSQAKGASKSAGTTQVPKSGTGSAPGKSDSPNGSPSSADGSGGAPGASPRQSAGGSPTSAGEKTAKADSKQAKASSDNKDGGQSTAQAPKSGGGSASGNSASPNANPFNKGASDSAQNKSASGSPDSSSDSPSSDSAPSQTKNNSNAAQSPASNDQSSPGGGQSGSDAAQAAGGSQPAPSPASAAPNSPSAGPSDPPSGGDSATPPSTGQRSDKPDSLPPLGRPIQSASINVANEGQRKVPGFISASASNAVSLQSSPVVFLVDQSYSMRGKKSELAQQQLSKLLGGLDKKTFFYIVFFHSSGYDPMPSPGPVPATRENIQSMLKWSSTVRHVFGSKPDKAADLALGFHPATVWVISDGKFPAAAAEKVTKSNRITGARINTVDIQNPNGEKKLRDLSDKNKGSYHFVPAL